MSTDVVNLLAWAAGVVGVSGITATIRHSRRFSRQYRFLRLDRSASCIDIVLPTSDRLMGGVGIEYLRSTTAVGNLKGATEIAETVGHVLRRRPVSVAVSGEIESRLKGDLVLLGLPAKNRASQIALDHLRRMHPTIGFDLTEEGGCSICLGGFSAHYELTCQDGTPVPSSDFALILVWVNPTSVRKHRLLLCGGFTHFGTAAAARYLMTDVIETRYRRLRQQFKDDLPALYGNRRWPCFAMVIETTLVNDQVVDIQEVAFVPLPDPGTPPFSAPERVGFPNESLANGVPGESPAEHRADGYQPSHFPPRAGTDSTAQGEHDPVHDH